VNLDRRSSQHGSYECFDQRSDHIGRGFPKARRAPEDCVADAEIRESDLDGDPRSAASCERMPPKLADEQCVGHVVDVSGCVVRYPASMQCCANAPWETSWPVLSASSM